MAILCIYRVGHKNVALYFCPYLCQLSTDFHNSFTGTLCRQFAIVMLSTIVNLVYITYCTFDLFYLPHHHMTTPCEL